MDDDDEIRASQDEYSARVEEHVRKKLEEARQQAPPQAFEIPQALYEKARDHQDQLTDDERNLLLSRGDVVGRALARPESLTEAERNVILLRPPPEVVRENIQRATGGTLSTVDELYAKARADLTSLSIEELRLVAWGFHAQLGQPRLTLGNPGIAESSMLLLGRAKFELTKRASLALRAHSPWNAQTIREALRRRRKETADEAAAALALPFRPLQISSDGLATLDGFHRPGGAPSSSFACCRLLHRRSNPANSTLPNSRNDGCERIRDIRVRIPSTGRGTGKGWVPTNTPDTRPWPRTPGASGSGTSRQKAPRPIWRIWHSSTWLACLTFQPLTGYGYSLPVYLHTCIPIFTPISSPMSSPITTEYPT